MSGTLVILELLRSGERLEALADLLSVGLLLSSSLLFTLQEVLLFVSNGEHVELVLAGGGCLHGDHVRALDK